MASFVCPICSSYSSGMPNVFFIRSMDGCMAFTAIAMCSTRLIFMAPPSGRKKLEHQPVHLVGVLVRGPVPGPGNPMHVERADRRADLADQQVGRTERGVVLLAPEQADAAVELREIAQQRAAAAHLAAVEARAADAVRLDVERLVGDAGRIAEHVDEQVVAA